MNAGMHTVLTRYYGNTSRAGPRIAATSSGVRRIWWYRREMSFAENHWAAAALLINGMWLAGPVQWAGCPMDEVRWVFVTIRDNLRILPSPTAALSR